MKAFNTIFKKSVFLCLAILSIAGVQAAEGWYTSIDEAVAKAKEENKQVMVKFTGSDWCGPCKMIQKAVFSKKAFADKVKDKFILCVIDVPNGDKELAEKNRPLLKKYSIRGYPTVVLFDGEGKEFTRYNPTAFPTVDKMV